MQLPWELEFEPEPIEGASVALGFEPGASRLGITMKNVGDTVIRPRELRLVAEVDAPAAGGWVWIQGRYMQQDALVRRFAEPAAEGYDGRFVRELDGGGRRYVGREALTLTLPSKPTSTLLAGCLRMDRFPFDIEVELSEDEYHAEKLALVFDLRGVELQPGAALELPPVLLT